MNFKSKFILTLVTSAIFLAIVSAQAQQNQVTNQPITPASVTISSSTNSQPIQQQNASTSSQNDLTSSSTPSAKIQPLSDPSSTTAKPEPAGNTTPFTSGPSTIVTVAIIAAVVFGVLIVGFVAYKLKGRNSGSHGI